MIRGKGREVGFGGVTPSHGFNRAPDDDPGKGAGVPTPPGALAGRFNRAPDEDPGKGGRASTRAPPTRCCFNRAPDDDPGKDVARDRWTEEDDMLQSGPGR